MDVLIVDDNLLMQQVMARFLGDLGYVVAIASRADEALELARQTPPALVLIDLGLPDMDGLQMLRAMRTLPECATIPVVAMSGMEEQDIKPLLSGGFSQYLAKPIELDVLETTIAHYVGKARACGDESS